MRPQVSQSNHTTIRKSTRSVDRRADPKRSQSAKREAITRRAERAAKRSAR